MCSASKEAVESARLTLDDVKALVAYYQPLYFAHYALVQAIFGALPPCELGEDMGAGFVSVSSAYRRNVSSILHFEDFTQL